MEETENFILRHVDHGDKGHWPTAWRRWYYRKRWPWRHYHDLVRSLKAIKLQKLFLIAPKICRSHPVLQPVGITQVAIARASLDQALQSPLFSFSKFGPSWIYQLSIQNPKSTPSLNRVASFCIVTVTKSFNPEKYGTLCKCLSDIYATTGTPVKVLEAWLIAVRGAQLDGYEPLSFTKSQAMLATSLKGTSKFIIQAVKTCFSPLSFHIDLFYFPRQRRQKG